MKALIRKLSDKSENDVQIALGLLLWCAVLLLMLVGTRSAGATTLTFESEPGPETSYWSWYSGFTRLTEARYQAEWANTTTYPSGEYAIFNTYGAPNQSLQGPLSVVDGIWASTWTAYDEWYDPNSVHTLTVQGWGPQGYTESVTWELTPEFKYYETGFTDQITNLSFHTSSYYKWYLLDDMNLTVNPDALTAAMLSAQRDRDLQAFQAIHGLPEPDTWILLACGVGGILLWGRREQKR